jgi:hypothetical protein
MRKIKSHPKTSVLTVLALVSAGAALVRYRRAR